MRAGASVGHPEIHNRTPFAFEPLHIADEDMRPVVVTLVKATFDFDLEGAVWLSEQQLPVNPAGEQIKTPKAVLLTISSSFLCQLS